MRYFLSVMICLAMFGCSKPGVVGNWQFESAIPLDAGAGGGGEVAAVTWMNTLSEGSTFQFAADHTITVKDKSGKPSMTGKYDFNADEKTLKISSPDGTESFSTKVFKETIELTDTVEKMLLTLKRVK